jgi:hypothetical protein
MFATARELGQQGDFFPSSLWQIPACSSPGIGAFLVLSLPQKTFIFAVAQPIFP